MAVIALVSAKSSGVTTAALALALSCPRPSLLSECDMAGGTVRAGYLHASLDARVGLQHLAVADRQGPDVLAEAFVGNLHPLAERAGARTGPRELLAGLTDPLQAPTLSGTWPALAEMLHVMDQQQGYDVFVDGGRLAFENGALHPVLTPGALLHRADLVLVVTGSSTASLTLTRHVLPVLRQELESAGNDPQAVGVLLVQRKGGYRAPQVSHELEAPVLAALPWDEPVAAYLAGRASAPRQLARTELMRHARSACDSLRAAAERLRLRRDYAPHTNPAMAGAVQRLAAPHGEAVREVSHG